MTRPRSLLVHAQKSGVYHCHSRCVRRAFLCGRDPLTQQDYSHRKEWLRNLMMELSTIFFIDVCGYAIMPNHFHIILRNRPDLADKVTDEEVAIRWYRLFPRRRNQYFEPEDPTPKEIDDVLARADGAGTLRKHLTSISWFMRCLKEPIARRANKEDQCTGRFWEGRFKSVALLDQAAILACSAYVDLNPIRAGLAKTPEESEFTSVKERIVAHKAQKKKSGRADSDSGGGRRYSGRRNDWLCPLMDQTDRKGYLNLSFAEYLQILEATGRQLAPGKSGRIPDHLESILVRLGIKPDQWQRGSQSFGSLFFNAVGKPSNLEKAARETGRKWFRGKQSCAAIFIDHPDQGEPTNPRDPSATRMVA